VSGVVAATEIGSLVIHSRARLARVHSTGERAQQIAGREDADQATEVRHERRANVAFAHPLCDLAERVLRRDNEQLGRHDLADRPHVPVVLRLLAGERKCAAPGLQARKIVRTQLDLDGNGAGRDCGRFRLADIGELARNGARLRPTIFAGGHHSGSRLTADA
jgi:hypothetical protein